MRNKLAEAKTQLSIRRILTDGSLLSGVSGTLIVGSLYYNPEIWHDDYPPEIQEKAAPMSDVAKRQRLVVAIPTFVALLGILISSNLKLKRQNHGELSFISAFLNTYSVFTVFNLFDLLVIDYLIMIRMRPGFAVLPGTEGMEAYNDVFFHVEQFLKGAGYGTVPSAIIAFLVTRKWKR